MGRDHAFSIAQQVADELAETGTRAVALVGSRARGDAGPESDLDILAVGPESFSWRLERREGFLVSTSMKSYEAYSKDFGLPEEVCTAVPGWREAVILYDPEGLASSLVREAQEWGWDSLERRCDAWVAERITGYAEEVHKLVSAQRGGNRSSAAIQRSLLAVHLAPVLAVHRRILYGSENGLWDLVCRAMGEEWRRTQSAALGLDGEPLEGACTAALELYGLAADAVWPLLDRRQRDVVGRACELAGKRAL